MDIRREMWGCTMFDVGMFDVKIYDVGMFEVRCVDVQYKDVRFEMFDLRMPAMEGSIDTSFN